MYRLEQLRYGAALPGVRRVFVAGDRLIQLRNAGVLPAQVSLALPAVPETPIATLKP